MDYSEKHFERLYKAYYPAMYRLAYSITEDEDDSRDAVGHVFARLWKRQPQIDADSIRGYLLSAVRNQSISILRGRMPTAAMREDLIIEQSRQQELEHEELMDGLNRIINEQLTDQDRRILAMHYEEDMTYQQTADALGISTSAVNKHITASLSKIRKALKKMLR